MSLYGMNTKRVHSVVTEFNSLIYSKKAESGVVGAAGMMKTTVLEPRFHDRGDGIELTIPTNWDILNAYESLKLIGYSLTITNVRTAYESDAQAHSSGNVMSCQAQLPFHVFCDRKACLYYMSAQNVPNTKQYTMCFPEELGKKVKPGRSTTFFYKLGNTTKNISPATLNTFINTNQSLRNYVENYGLQPAKAENYYTSLFFTMPCINDLDPTIVGLSLFPNAAIEVSIKIRSYWRCHILRNKLINT